jgi:hypothetical protein
MHFSNLFARLPLTKSVRRRASQAKRRNQRRMFLEPLEARQLMAAIRMNPVFYAAETEEPSSREITLAFWREDPGGDFSDTVTVNWEIDEEASTAIAGLDHDVPLSGSFDLGEDETNKDLYYMVQDDDHYDPDETIVFKITSVTSTDGSKYYDYYTPVGQVQIHDPEGDPVDPKPTLPGCDTCSTAANSDHVNDASNGGASAPAPTNSGGSPAVSSKPVRYGDGVVLVSTSDLRSEMNGQA